MRGRAGERVTVLVVAAGVPVACPVAALAQGDPLGEPFPTVLPTSDIDGEIGFVIQGVDDGDGFGLSVGALGDFNGDGIDDVIIGAPSASPIGQRGGGKAYIIFGSGSGFPMSFDAASLDGGNGLVLEGVSSLASGERAGFSVDGAGDLNNDGARDAIIGTQFARFPDLVFAGKAYVVFGRQDGTFDPSASLADLDGSDGFVLTGSEFNNLAGRSVSSAGDTNGDGIDDVIIGVPGRGEGRYVGHYYRCCPGAAYVLFGRDVPGGATSFPAAGQLASIPREEGYVILGGDVDGDAGFAVSSAGDVNGDGFDDLLVSAPEVDTYYGEAYVVFGKPTAQSSTLSVRSLNGTNGFKLTLPQTGSYTGLAQRVDTAGDFNGDGIDDLMVEPTFDGAFVVFGRTDGFPAVFDLSTLDGTNGTWLQSFGTDDIAAIGDINGDGIDDVAVSNPTAPGAAGFSGAVYVVYGRRDGFPATLTLADLDGSEGFRVEAAVTGEGLGASVSSAGDINGDGNADLIIGASRTSAPGDAGRAIVVYGRSPGCSVDLDGDGDLTLFDFLAFQNLFDAGDPIADFDGDGRLTLFDFLAFQNAFDAGCP
ncbi:MAG: FG-GAP repeat protein [Phycisphaerales bacterium]|nr:FG-GAP repeat protein [Phycisphaerales bacterium]